MAKVMSWDGLNLPAQNLTTNTAGPGDLTPTLVDNYGLAQYGRWNVGDWAIQQSNVKSKRSAIAFGSLGSRGSGNLNSREFQVVFYMRFADVGPFTGRRFRFFRAYDTDAKWLATLRFEGRYEVVLTEQEDSVSLGRITPGNWTRFEVSYNRRSGVIAARMSDTAFGSWKRISMDSYNRNLKRLDRVAFGSYESDSPSWFQLRNILVNDDSYPVDTQYTPPKAPRINSSIINRKIALNESVTFNASVVQGDAAINGRWWTLRSGGIDGIPAVSASTPPYLIEPTTKTYSGEDIGEGRFTVTFTVRDTNNFEVRKTFGLTVGAADSPPDATILFPSVFVGQSSTIVATVTDVGQNAETVAEILWEQVDGPAGVDITAADQLTTPVGPFRQAGSYTFKVTLTNDRDQSMEFTASQEITAATPPEAVIVNPAGDTVEMLTGENVIFRALETPGSLPIVLREWSTTPVGGQITGQGTDTATIRFPLADTYSVSYSVTDILGTTTISENKIAQVNQAYPPSIVFPPDATINLEEESEVFVSAVVEEGSYPISSYEWELMESPNNVGATIEYTSDTTITVKDFVENGFYRLQLRVTDSTGINVGIGEFQIYAYAGSTPIDPTRPIDPLDWMTNEQLRLKASQRMSGTPDGNTTQIIKRYYISVVDHPDKHHMSFHQLEREFYKGLVNGDIDVNLALYGLIDGGGALRLPILADGETDD